MSDDKDKRKRVAGPVPLNIATESVLVPNVLEQQLGRVVLTVAGVALAYWLAKR